MGPSATDLELSRQQAQVLLSAWLGQEVRNVELRRMHGGMVNSVLHLTFDRAPARAVVKLHTPGYSFEREARNLQVLRREGLPCPDVYAIGDGSQVIPYAYLLLEALPGLNLWEARARLAPTDRSRVERELADALIRLHAHTRETFGAIDEASGSSRWVDVFVPRLREVRAKSEVATRLSRQVLRWVDQAIERAPHLLSSQGVPRLIHGDIWAANVLVVERPDGWHLSGLVDPSAQYADVELELAYLKVFDTVGEAFFRRYTEAFPLREGYEARWLVYWLHTYLIHVWYFGDPYYRQMTARVAQALCGAAI